MEKEKLPLNSLLDNLKSGKIPIGVLSGKPKRWIVRYGKQRKVISLYPQFINCLRAKCFDILKCWDLDSSKYKGEIGKHGSILYPEYCQYRLKLERLFLGKKLGKRQYITHPSSLSEIENSLLFLALQDFINSHKIREAQVNQLLQKLKYSEKITLHLKVK